MKKLSDTLTELGIDCAFPIEIMEANDRVTYCENSDGYWCKYEYDANGKQTYCEDSTGYWHKYEYDADGNETYFENSTGYKRGTPKSAKTREGEVIEVDGIKYKLKAL